MKEKFECTCNECKAACQHKPGWFMPGEAEKTAKYLKLSFQDFFNKYLGVDWWEDDTPIFTLAPAIVGEETGSEYPGNPKGQCVFFNNNELCDIHPVKPFECARMNCDETNINGCHEKVAKAWVDNQTQIIELLGREPKTEGYYGGLFDF